MKLQVKIPYNIYILNPANDYSFFFFQDRTQVLFHIYFDQFAIW